MGQLLDEAFASFREGMRHKKIDRQLSDALTYALSMNPGFVIDRERFTQCYGPERSAELLERIDAICDETVLIEIGRGQAGNPARVKRTVMRTMRDKHPELSEGALHTLGDYFVHRWPHE